MDIFTLILACTPLLPLDTVAAVIQAESDGNPLAINVNAEDLTLPEPENAQAAAAMARELIEQGINLDLGLMQINTENLLPLNLTAEDVFDPCKNIQAGTALLQENYRRAIEAGYSPGRAAFNAALSAYNTGKFQGKAGQRYVARVYKTSGLSFKAKAPDPFSAPTKVYSRSRDEEKKDTDANAQKPNPPITKRPFNAENTTSQPSALSRSTTSSTNPYTAPTKVWQRAQETASTTTTQSPASPSASSPNAE
jgi:type IV secretion system protein VirB1